MITLKRPLIEMSSRLQDIPELWLKLVEPYIMRGPYLPCWIWTGGMDDEGFALVRHTALKRTYKGHRFVAELFWDYPKNFYIGHTCQRPNCLYPGHLVPQSSKKLFPPLRVGVQGRSGAARGVAGR
jgi:hypothetical protein